jgi:tetratricopeptide (TPR) repeat protein
LANTSRAEGDFDEAKEILEYYRDNISDNSSIHFQLHRLYRQQGKLDQALLELNKGDTLNPHPRFIRSRAIIYYLKDELAAAGLELQKLLEVQDRLYHVSSRGYLADLFLMQGKYKDAKDQVGPAIDLLVELDETGWIAWWHSYLFYILYRTADFEDALKECDRMWKIAQDEEDFEDQVEALHNRGLALVAMKSHDEAIKTADELKVMIEQWLNQRLIRWYYHLKGEIELAQKNYSAAVDHFQQAIALVPYGPLNKDALFVESLASALYRSGDLERALLEYQRITALTTGRLSYGDIYAKSFYMLAKIYEQLGDKTKAIEHYERFLNLWKDADPGLTEVEDARKNLAGLINN